MSYIYKNTLMQIYCTLTGYLEALLTKIILTPMTTNPRFVDHLFIIDTSVRSTRELQLLQAGINDSIMSIRRSSLNNELCTHRISLMIIDTKGVQCLYHAKDINEVSEFSMNSFSIGADIRLYDGIGTSIGTWRALGQRNQKNGKTSITIFTRGVDGGSCKYSICTIKSIIQHLKQRDWQFMLIGNHSLLPFIAQKMGIDKYYNRSNVSVHRERNFVISQLVRQWRQQQLIKTNTKTKIKAA